MAHRRIVNSVGRQKFACGRQQIHRWKSQGMSDMIAMLHCSHQCIRHSQHLFGLFHPALFHQLADVSGTDFDAVHFDLLYGLDAKAQMRRHSLQKFGISCAVLAKRQILACRHKPGIHLFGQNLCCKTLWLCGCSLLRKRKLDQSVDSQTFKQASFFLSGGQFFTVRQAEQHCRCRVKGEHARRQPIFFSAKNLFQKSPVAQMDSVKFTDGYCCIFFQIKVCCSCNDFQVYFLLSVLLGKIFTGLYHSFVSSYA